MDEYILLVEDDIDYRESIAEFLEDEGYSTLQASNGKEGLEIIEQEPVALVLLDIRMPNYDGKWLLKRVKPKYEELAVVMITSLSDTKTAIECLVGGAEHYLIKPLNLTELSTTVKRVLEKRSLQIELREYRENLELKVLEKTQQIREMFLGSILSYANIIEARDPYLRGHSERVAGIAEAMGKALGFENKKLENLRIAGFLHDIGKFGVSESILNKNGRLSEEEFEAMKQHPQRAVTILKPIINQKEILQSILSHHERYDGKGYPMKLSGGDIPLGGRIIAVADTYDALTSDRAYRKGFDHQEAIMIMSGVKGTQLDPTLVELFLELVRKKVIKV